MPNATNIPPAGCLTNPTGDQVFNSKSFSETCSEYVLKLSTQDQRDVDKALRLFKGRSLGLDAVSRSTFPLPRDLARRLAAISDQIHTGRGFAVVRGLRPSKYNREENVIIYAGIAAYVCPQRATDPVHQLTLTHIRDATRDAQPAFRKGLGLPGSKVPDALQFHADRFAGDVLSLYVMNTGSTTEGGDQHIASFHHIYNELAQSDPAVLQTLAADDWPWELKDVNYQNPYVEYAPAMFCTAGRPIIQLVRAPLLGTKRLPRNPDLPKITPAQGHALRAVERLASENSVKLDRRNGDIQFFNNLCVLHARTAYCGDKPSKRHLLRMFLRDPRNAWAKPDEYAHLFDSAFCEGRPESFPTTDFDPWLWTASGTSFAHG